MRANRAPRRALSLGLAALAATPLLWPATGASGEEPGGRAWIDYDGDGDLDLFVANAHGPEKLFRSDPQGLVDVSLETGLEGRDIEIAAWEDFDQDGDLDLFAVESRGSQLLRNDGGSFVDATVAAGLAHDGRDLDAAWIDPDGDGRADLEIEQVGRALIYTNTGGVFERTELALPVSEPAQLAGPGRLDAADATERDAPAAPSLAPRVRNGRGALAPATSRVRAPRAASAAPAASLPPAVPLQPELACAGGLIDQDGGGCLQASSEPTQGALFPLGPDFFVAPTGDVGVGTLTPQADLHVVNRTATGRTVVQGPSSQPVRSEIVLASGSPSSGFRMSNTANGMGSRFELDSVTGVFPEPHLSILGGVGSVGVNIGVPLYRLHVYDEISVPQMCISGGPSSAQLLIEADDDNADESDQPRVTLSQDGGQVIGTLGFLGGTNDLTLANEFGAARVVVAGDGAVRLVDDALGLATLELDPNVHGGGQLVTHDTAGVAMTALDTNVASGGGRIRLWDGTNANPMLLIEAQEGTTGANMYLRNAAGSVTFELDAENGNGAGARMWLRDGAGATTISLNAETGRTQTASLEITGGSDIAEPFDVLGEDVAPGMLVAIDAARPGELELSSAPYQRTLVGVISGAGGIRPGMTLSQEGTLADGEHPVALAGRVWCWADASAAPIEPGDLLTSSDVPGHAMAAKDQARAFGAVIGKAMTSLSEGRGLVLVWVNLQ